MESGRDLSDSAVGLSLIETASLVGTELLADSSVSSSYKNKAI